MLDAIIFERLGVPAAPIITEPFAATCRALAELQSMPDYRFVQVEHPITSLGPGELRERARDAAPYVEALLVQGVPWPEAAGTVAAEGIVDDRDRALSALVEELAVGLRADGADLSACFRDPQTVRFELHIPDRACAECVMPAEHLVPVFERRTVAHLGAGITVQLDDPREHRGE